MLGSVLAHLVGIRRIGRINFPVNLISGNYSGYHLKNLMCFHEFLLSFIYKSFVFCGGLPQRETAYEEQKSWKGGKLVIIPGWVKVRAKKK